MESATGTTCGGALQFKGGGARKDSFEQQADKVAEHVVQGKSAQEALGPLGASSQTRAVQKKGTKKPNKEEPSVGNLEFSPPITASTKRLVIQAEPGKGRAGTVTLRANEKCRVDLQIAAADSDFSFVSPNGIELDEGEEYRALVRFLPRGRGTYRDTLKVKCTADAGAALALETVLRVELVGKTDGIPEPEEQKERGPYDISYEEPKTRDRVHRQPDGIPVELTKIENYEDWPIDNLGRNIVGQVRAGYANLEGALGIFETVLSAPSKNEAKERDAGLLAVDNIHNLVMKGLSKPLLSALPGGGHLYMIFKEALKVGGEIAAEKKRASKATVANAVKDFVVTRKEHLATSRAQLESGVESYLSDLRNHQKTLDEKGLPKFKFDLYFAADDMKGSLSDGLSISSLFATIARDWITETELPGGKSSRLVIALDDDWNLIDARILAPRGDRIAEALMRQQGGNLNLRQLAVPMEVRWYPAFNKPDSLNFGKMAYVSQSLQPDGTLIGSTRATSILTMTFHGITEKYRENLAKKGVPSITKLEGLKEY